MGPDLANGRSEPRVVVWAQDEALLHVAELIRLKLAGGADRAHDATQVYGWATLSNTAISSL